MQKRGFMKQCKTILQIRQAIAELGEGTLGLVPTMGYLHEGHLSLVRAAKEQNTFVAVSIFVNPMQFNNADDLNTYPRNIEKDLQLLSDAGVDVVWLPEAQDMYPPGFQTSVNVETISLPLEGMMRPGHFRGVATVVAKLFNVFQPKRAYFGQKDAQQVAVIKRMVLDMAFPLEIVVCPILREADGLAMSSRNARLSESARQEAPVLNQALTAAAEAIENGQRNAATLKRIMQNTITGASLARIEYLSIANAHTLEEMSQVSEDALLSLAVYFEDVRLIDNKTVFFTSTEHKKRG